MDVPWCTMCDLDFTSLFSPYPDCVRVANQLYFFLEPNLNLPVDQQAFLAESDNRIMDAEESEYEKLLKLDEDDHIDSKSKVMIIATSQVSVGLMLSSGTTCR